MIKQNHVQPDVNSWRRNESAGRIIRRRMAALLSKRIILGIVALGLAILIGGAGLFAFYASSAPDLDESLLKDPLTSDFVDRNGNVFMKFGAEKREFVPYKTYRRK